MDFSICLRQLETNVEVIRALSSPVGAGQAVWKPAPQDWSVLEVINHLADEEAEDFGARLRHLLEGKTGEWAPIAPQEWVTARAYNLRDLAESIDRYAGARRESLAWLRDLENADWTSRYAHPPLEGLSAGDLLVSWAGHDLLHLRQLVELQWAYLSAGGKPYAPDYAGDW
jgi:hypothetical protein